MLKIRLLILSALALMNTAIAQDFLGYSNSNNVGVTGISLQPACIVDDRLEFDMTIIGGNMSLYNNYIGIKRSAFKKVNGEYPAFSDDKFMDNYLNIREDNKDKAIFTSARVNMPSFMVYANHKTAFAFTWDVRSFTNIDGVSPQLAKLILKTVDYPSYFLSDFTNKNLSLSTMMWSEYGFTFGHVLKEDNEHYFKAAGRLKLLQGIFSAYMFAKDFKFQFTTDDTISIVQSHIGYGHSDNVEIKDGKPNLDIYGSYPGIGADLGIVYEYRPDYQKFKYDMDGEKGLWRRDKDKYKLRIGFSVLDLGGIKFKKNEGSNDFVANINLLNLNKFAVGSMKEFDDSLRKTFPPQDNSSTYKMSLPTALSLQIDYHIWKDFYINATPYYAFQFNHFQFANRDSKIHDYTTLSISPRWDHRWFGVFIPVRYNTFDHFRCGLTLRLGPIVFGTSNLGPLVSKQDFFGTDFHFLIKIPIEIPHPHDKDKDGVSNKKDKCPDVPGTWEFMGCADKDGDHVQDHEDKCPDIPGLKELNGCPDKDGDKITDAEDACPDDSGLVEFKGCPDRDGDKIIDHDDECPTDSGLVEFMGCPDRDGDKVPDRFDACPDLPGPAEYKGCPDRDGDKVLDKNDDCPDVPGAVDNKGCPYPDTDKDGVYDKDDECVNTPGPPENKGCPVIKQEEQKILEQAFSSLEFASGKDIIKKTSYPSLDALAKLMKEHSTDWTLKLSGHTDNQGTPQSNMKLSEKRVLAVKKYLTAKGAKADRIIAEWFGQSRPIDSNDTEAGRQKNRRVEMKVLFK